MGRWMSPDWSAKAEPVPYAKLDNPQSLNLYAYALNNPLRNVDVDGHCDSSANATARTKCQDLEDLHLSDAMKTKLKVSEGLPGTNGKPMLEVKDIGDGHLTVGWGHKDDGMTKGTKITEEQAQAFFDQDVAVHEKATRDALMKNGGHQYSQGEFDALTDLVYNGGPAMLTSDESPKLVKAMNAGDYNAMSEQLRYTLNDKGEPMKGLVDRSNERKKIFGGSDPL